MNVASSQALKPLHPTRVGRSTVESEVFRQYGLIRATVSLGTSVALFHIGEKQTALAIGCDAEPLMVLVFAMGAQSIANTHFKHKPPTPDEMEDALVLVDDEVSKVQTVLLINSKLFTMDKSLRDIALIAGVPAGAEMLLTVNAVELTFDRLAAVVLGRPEALEEIPTDATFTANLLILHELMLTLNFSSITIKG